MRLATSDEFRSRLTALESWLWSEGATECGMIPPSIDVLASRVEDLSDRYTVDRDRLPRGHLLPRLLYFLCSDAPKVHVVLRELVDRHGEDRVQASNVADLGCGVGASAAGLLLSLEAGSPLSLLGVDVDPLVLPLWSAVVRRCAAIAGAIVELRTEIADVRRFEPSPDVSLLLSQSTLNECLREPVSGEEPSIDGVVAERVGRWARARPCILIEPALRVATRPLHAMRDAVVAQGGVRVLAPCPHQCRCPMLGNPRDWCHEVRAWPPTPQVAAVQELTRRRDDRLKFSFVALAPADSATVPVAESRGSRNQLQARLVSDPLASKGKVERFACTAQGSLRRLRLLDRERTASNRGLADAERGAMVIIDGLGSGDRVVEAVCIRPMDPAEGRPPRSGS